MMKEKILFMAEDTISDSFCTREGACDIGSCNIFLENGESETIEWIKSTVLKFAL